MSCDVALLFAASRQKLGLRTLQGNLLDLSGFPEEINLCVFPSGSWALFPILRKNYEDEEYGDGLSSLESGVWAFQVDWKVSFLG